MFKKILFSILAAIFVLAPIAQALTVNSAVNLSITNNSDGWQASGGTTSRLFTITGSAWTLGNNTIQDSTGTFTLPGATTTIAGLGTVETWTAAQTFTNSDILLLGSSTGATTFTSDNAGATNYTMHVPAANDTLVDLVGTQTLTHKTLTDSTNVLGGVTMTLGSDATADVYYRNSSGYLTRLGQPGANEILGYDSTDAIPAYFVLGTGLTYTHSTHTLSASAAGFSPPTTTVVTGTSQSASTNNNYITNNAGLVTVTTPTTCAVGDWFEVEGLGAGGWKIAQNASQNIHFGSTVTTTGTGGYLSSNNQYDSVSMTCAVANTTWLVDASVGNITVN